MKHKESRILNELTKKIKKIAPEVEVFLFGSKARGDDAPDSDIDLLILIDKNDKKKIEKIMDTCFQFELDYEVVISPLIHSKKEWSSFPFNVSEIKYFIEKEGVDYEGGVRALFHKEFIKANVIPLEMGKFFDKMFINRQKGGYDDCS